ncbi:MAG: c-type cytochrome biogenesis protein CcsB [Frankiales bacterium]|nr:c-type cytochrome biogenesis protein CcsB [Frankiales bacterium]
MLAFAGEQAARRSRVVAASASHAVLARQAAAARTRAMAGAGGVVTYGTSYEAPPAPVVPAAPAARPSRAGQLGLALAYVGAALHLGSIVTRGFAADRVPWGNMYEFSSAVALTAVVAFLVMVATGRVDRGLGAFIMLPAVLYLGLAGTVLYTAAGPLVPALDSYWIKIHVFAAILSSGAFLLSGVVALLYLLRARHDGQVAAGRIPRFPLSMGASLPAAPVLDRVSYAVIAFAFPIWTFAIIAGAIWAESAWGRYWGWDPKETWSFITWVLYAGYLHARATAGFKGTKAAWIGVAAAGALIIDYYVVNIFVVGFHSYA